MNCLTLAGVASIQSYIFRSNKLSENAGASELLRDALESWKGRRAPNHPRVIYIGGGNAALVFESLSAARDAVYQWSLEWLKLAPGLRFTAAHAVIGAGNKAAYDSAIDSLRNNEDAPPFGADMGALPVVRACQSTGLAASEPEPKRNPAAYFSSEAIKKRRYAEKAYQRLTDEYREVLGDDYEFPKEFEELGTFEGASQLAIVHADTNGLGRRFSDAARNAGDGDLFATLTALSDQSRNFGKIAFSTTIKALTSAIPELLQDEVIRCNPTPRQKMFLPLRPLVEGGDDLTIVCHGKLGLSLAKIFLEEFENLAHAETLTACAGVLIMPGKFPFARGYQMAEALVTKAKERHREHGGSWLDFQVILEGSAGSLETIRETQYRDIEGKSLLSRPLCVTPGATPNWKVFNDYWRHFSNPKVFARSRAKRLLEVLPHGDGAAAELARVYEAAGVDMPARSAYRDYWDALEMLDFHVKWPDEARHHA